MKFKGNEWAAIREGKTIYTVRRKSNQDDGTWWVVVKANKQGFEYIARAETKQHAQILCNMFR